MTIKKMTFLLYLTIGIAIVQSMYEHIITSDFAHQIISTYFIIECIILGVAIFIGLKNKFGFALIALLTLTESILFLLNIPISPDEFLMVLIFCIRIYILIWILKRNRSQQRV